MCPHSGDMGSRRTDLNSSDTNLPSLNSNDGQVHHVIPLVYKNLQVDFMQLWTFHLRGEECNYVTLTIQLCILLVWCSHFLYWFSYVVLCNHPK